MWFVLLIVGCLLYVSDTYQIDNGPGADYQQDDYKNTIQPLFGVKNPSPEILSPRLMTDFYQEKMKFADDGKRRRGGPQNLQMPAQVPRKLDSDEITVALKNLTVSYRSVNDWPNPNESGFVLGGVSGVSLDQRGNVLIFHRADRIWNLNSFNRVNVYMEKDLGPINSDTILALDRKTGLLRYSFGRNLFYLPHGITVDAENNVWVTDVALHQVMKLNKEQAHDDPLMVLGRKFNPGSGRDKFCKPTSVAVLPDSGDFFVADGYCNARIVKFSKRGEWLMEWGKNTFQGRSKTFAPENYFAVPHGLTLALDKGLLCVADRENGRVQCFYHSNGTFHSQYHGQLIGDRLFSVAYAPVKGGQLYVVNGPLFTGHQVEVKGFVIDMASGNVTSKFPGDVNYSNPHDIAVTEDGQEVYVAEYDPYRIHKLISVDAVAKSLHGPSSATGDTASVGGGITNKPTSTAKAFLILAFATIFGFLIAAIGLALVRHRKRGMAGDDNEDDVEYSRLMKSSRNDQ